MYSRNLIVSWEKRSGDGRSSTHFFNPARRPGLPISLLCSAIVIICLSVLGLSPLETGFRGKAYLGFTVLPFRVERLKVSLENTNLVSCMLYELGKMEVT